MCVAIIVAVAEGKLVVPRWPYVIAQDLIGCLVARSIGPVSHGSGRPLGSTLALAVVGAIVGLESWR